MEDEKERAKATWRKWWKSPNGRAYRERKRSLKNEQHKKYRQSEKGKATQHRKRLNMESKYPEKFSARSKLRYAVKVGRIERLPCEVCGMSPSFGHHSDYSKPFDVNWLCQKHHREIHGDRS